MRHCTNVAQRPSASRESVVTECWRRKPTTHTTITVRTNPLSGAAAATATWACRRTPDEVPDAGEEVTSGCACLVGEHPKWMVRMEVYCLGASMELQQKHNLH